MRYRMRRSCSAGSTWMSDARSVTAWVIEQVHELDDRRVLDELVDVGEVVDRRRTRSAASCAIVSTSPSRRWNRSMSVLHLARRRDDGEDLGAGHRADVVGREDVRRVGHRDDEATLLVPVDRERLVAPDERLGDQHRRPTGRCVMSSRSTNSSPTCVGERPDEVASRRCGPARSGSGRAACRCRPARARAASRSAWVIRPSFKQQRAELGAVRHRLLRRTGASPRTPIRCGYRPRVDSPLHRSLVLETREQPEQVAPVARRSARARASPPPGRRAAVCSGTGPGVLRPASAASAARSSARSSGSSAGVSRARSATSTAGTAARPSGAPGPDRGADGTVTSSAASSGGRSRSASARAVARAARRRPRPGPRRLG